MGHYHAEPGVISYSGTAEFEFNLRLAREVKARLEAEGLQTRLIGDKGYDSDPLDTQLRRDYGIEMIARNRRGRRRTQDGRSVRRAKRRWKIERLFAWLHNSRRLVTRWERYAANFLGFLHLACAKILLSHL